MTWPQQLAKFNVIDGHVSLDLLISVHSVLSLSSSKTVLISKARLIPVLVGTIKLILRSLFFNHTFIPVKALN